MGLLLNKKMSRGNSIMRAVFGLSQYHACPLTVLAKSTHDVCRQHNYVQCLCLHTLRSWEKGRQVHTVAIQKYTQQLEWWAQTLYMCCRQTCIISGYMHGTVRGQTQPVVSSANRMQKLIFYLVKVPFSSCVDSYTHTYTARSFSPVTLHVLFQIMSISEQTQD